MYKKLRTFVAFLLIILIVPLCMNISAFIPKMFQEGYQKKDKEDDANRGIAGATKLTVIHSYRVAKDIIDSIPSL
ncbi:MAG: hypothetical protein CMF51_01460 [Legionellales bacterium]|nr:hypothetical protein [Legionellales bacterium]